MKKIRLTLTALAAVLMMTVTAISANAAYKYKVTVLAGLHGQVNGTDKVETEFTPGAQWFPDKYTVTVTDDRYYFKGFHVSGIEDLSTGGVQDINKDMVFVAAYGMKGNTVAYTVKYLDQDGKELAPTATYYGNVGDKPVVAYVYVENYIPQTFNITGTLKPNAADNVFTFVYTPAAEAGTGGGGYTYVDGGTEIIYLPATTGGNAGGGNAGGNAGANAGANPGGNAGNNAGDNGNNGGGQENTGPAQIIDIDDPNVPMASASPAAEVTPEPTVPAKPGLSTFWKAVIGICGLGILALLIVLFLMLKRRREEQE